MVISETNRTGQLSNSVLIFNNYRLFLFLIPISRQKLQIRAQFSQLWIPMIMYIFFKYAFFSVIFSAFIFSLYTFSQSFEKWAFVEKNLDFK